MREVEQARRLRPGVLLGGGIAALLLGMMLGANVRLYERRQENLTLETAVQERRQELQELKRQMAEQPDLSRQAEALGLQPLDPEQVEILHIRGGMAD